MSTSVHLHLAKMEAHVLILLEVIAVIVNQDILATTVKQISMSVQLHRAKMVAHVLILLDITAVIARLDGLDQLARKKRLKSAKSNFRLRGQRVGTISVFGN
ncbi:uncharacterized protein LOC144640540 isoform X2 [Oculina patagonica]